MTSLPTPLTAEELMAKPAKSAVIELLDLIWSNANDGTAHSWERLNHAMRDALSLAVGAGLTFAEGDVRYILSHYHTGRWIGESDEWVYRDAVAVGNMSAVKSFEEAKGREPFIVERVNLNIHTNGYMHGGGGTRQKERLVVGAAFKWQGVDVRVTSFADDQSHIVACSYKKVKGSGGYSTEKIDKRFKITKSELLEGRSQDRERKVIVERFRAINDEALRVKIAKRLRLAKWDDFATVALDKLRTALDKHAPLPPRPPRVKSVAITQEHIAAALKAGAGCQASRYRPGMKSSEIGRAHREWLIANCPEVAEQLGFIVASQSEAA